ncbi:MAG: non-ribosomal peptide synthetase [Alphaproteobacteria bacterium]|nr:non-ribosomal peptide synthetase [Alphaproteobacteria bacterium]
MNIDPSNHLLQVFEQRVSDSPDKIALVFKESQLSYCCLNLLAEKLAIQLNSKGMRPGEVVGIYLEKSLELIISVLAVLKVGAIYVPIDPAFPANRIHKILQATRPKIILGDVNIPIEMTGKVQVVPVILNDIMHFKLYTQDSFKRAYGHNFSIIYTSGSTGDPKSVLCNTTSVMNRLVWASNNLDYASSDICFFQAKFSFVDHLGELFFPLLNGIRLIVLEDNYFQDIEAYVKNMRQFLVNRLYLTPSFLALLYEISGIAEGLDKVKVLEVSGEVFKDELYKKVRKIAPNLKVLDRYGSSEATSVVYTYVDMNDNGSVRRTSSVIDNTELFILDEQLHQVEEGEIGELYISGLSLSDGYYKDATNTVLKFIPNPFNSTSAYRLYKTGDRVQRINGHYKFLGRTDNQIKLRGFRIDLCEVENVLIKPVYVKDAVVIFHSDKIFAFVVPEQSNNVDPDDLANLLNKELPDYMIPSKINVIEKLPMNNHGKLDRKILEEMVFLNERELLLESNSISPVEGKLCDIFSSLLSLQSVNPKDNFFRIGGDSLLAVQAMMRIKTAFGVHLPIPTIFRFPTIYELSTKIEEAKTASTSSGLTQIKRRATNV